MACLALSTTVKAEETIASEVKTASTTEVATDETITQTNESIEQSTSNSSSVSEETAEQMTEQSTVNSSDDAKGNTGGYTGDEGIMPTLRSRSDLYPSIQLFSAIPAVSVTNTNTPSKSFIDISSHNGTISVADFQKMKSYGVTGVVIKLTEATSYINPYAQSQINNAMTAGLKVSAYHYSWFKTDAEAVAEANYFAKAAKSFGLSSGTMMVNDGQ